MKFFLIVVLSIIVLLSLLSCDIFEIPEDPPIYRHTLYLSTINVDGTDYRRVLTLSWQEGGGERGYAFPMFTPDGNRIVYNNGSYIVDVDGTNQQSFLPYQYPSGYPSFSPDGSRVAYENNFKIFLMRYPEMVIEDYEQSEGYALYPIFNGGGG